MKNLGLFFNPEKKIPEKALQSIENCDYFNFYYFKNNGEFCSNFAKCFIDGQSLNAILVFGGDGTILRAVPFALKTNAAILGVNFGKMGFLSESHPFEIEKSLKYLAEKEFKTEERMLISVTHKRKGKIFYKAKALNDAVIYKGLVPGLIEIKIQADRRFVLNTRCDGIVVSTPTGSTAYSLSAGGPIISPVMNAVIVAPLNPHILTVRPMVFPAASQIHLKIINTHGQTILQIDGENAHTLEDGDDIYITQSQQKVRFIKLTNRTFYQILRRKLHMGKSWLLH